MTTTSATSSRSVPWLLDAWTGAITRIPAYERVGDRVRVRVDLVPGQSTIVVLAEPGDGRARAVLPAAGQEVVLHGSLPALRAYTAGVHEVSWPDGRVTKLEFYRDGQLMGTDSTAPYAFTLRSVPPGSYRLKVVAYDDQGATSAAAKSITVKNLAK